MVQWKIGPLNERKLMLEGPSFHWTMIVGGRVYQSQNTQITKHSQKKCLVMKSFIMGRWWESWWEGMGRMVRRVRTRDDEENHLDYSGTSCASDYLCVVHQSYRRCYGRAWHGPMKERSKLWNCLHIQDIALGKVTGIQQILVTWYPICWPGFQKIQRSMSLAYSTKKHHSSMILGGKIAALDLDFIRKTGHRSKHDSRTSSSSSSSGSLARRPVKSCRKRCQMWSAETWREDLWKWLQFF